MPTPMWMQRKQNMWNVEQQIIHWLCNQECFFSANHDAVVHQVLRQDAGEISPGRGREGGKGWCLRVIWSGLGFTNLEGGGPRGWGADFRGFVFNSSWILPPGVGQYLSHAVSTLFMSEQQHKWQLCRHKHALLILASSILLTNRSLYLAHDLIVRNCSPTLVVCNDLRLLINFLWKRFEHK